ncbi:hypothetical protein FHW84_003520 [Dyella sp. SG562]|uniref:hypothetical protein n=1 Tax=Dyella TaxID=231454 RepID=UPI0014233531|nr:MULTISPECIES: hypothetical protein [unclassified Dyella]NII74923.1 hypothetical protein [Dyella sp. SG562]NKJ20320.1 hypothetical protein [Dyella sp. SG609]
MVDARDPGTLQLPLAFKRSRGRPRKESPLTGAQRQARFRARREAQAQVLRERLQKALGYLEQGDTGMARYELESLVAATASRREEDALDT